MSRVKIPIPVVIAKEGKWFVASSPVLDIATQGKTEEEVRENMADLISDYFKDPDTPKPKISDVMGISITNIAVTMPEGVSHRKVAAASPA
jgi:predicted RNase H-like HicB family nuclease